MMKLMSIRRRACLTTALVAGVALASASLANARNNQHNDNNNKNTGARPHFVITGQSANAKRVPRDRKGKTKEVHCKKKTCEKLKGAAKDIGNGLENLGLGFINLGGPTSEPKTGTITQE